MNIRTLYTALPLLLLLILAGCTSKASYGTKLTFGKGSLYYTDSIPEGEARMLGEFLLEENYFDTLRRRAVQLRREGTTRQVRMVVDPDSLKARTDIEPLLKEMTGVMSQRIFNGARTEIHLCDDQLQTIRVIPYTPAPPNARIYNSAYGKQVELPGDMFYYTESVEREMAERVAAYLKEDGLLTGGGYVAQLTRAGETWQLRVAFKDGAENNPGTIATMEKKAGQLSTDLFDGQPTEIHLTDDALKTRRVIAAVR